MRMRINTTCYYRECANYTITIAIADFFRDSDNIDTFAQAYSIPRGAVQLLETHGHSTRQKTRPAF